MNAYRITTPKCRIFAEYIRFQLPDDRVERPLYPSLNWLENFTGYSFDELVITDPVRFAQVAFLNPEDENYDE